MKFKKSGSRGIKYVRVIMGLILLFSVGFSAWMLTNESNKPKSGPVLIQTKTRMLDQFEQQGIWKVDRKNHRCLIEYEVWVRLPLEQKEQCLQAIYNDEKTWWEIYDRMSGKLLGKVSSWGFKVYP